MTQDQLTQLCGSAMRAEVFCKYLTDAMAAFQVNTRRRQAMFLAQGLHETGALK